MVCTAKLSPSPRTINECFIFDNVRKVSKMNEMPKYIGGTITKFYHVISHDEFSNRNILVKNNKTYPSRGCEGGRGSAKLGMFPKFYHMINQIKKVIYKIKSKI